VDNDCDPYDEPRMSRRPINKPHRKNNSQYYRNSTDNGSYNYHITQKNRENTMATTVKTDKMISTMLHVMAEVGKQLASVKQNKEDTS
jgi:hypothetical protein